MVSSVQYLATQAAFAVLEAGGNAIDAGVTGCIALSVVDSDYVGAAGVAPMLIRTADGRVSVIDGVGTWPAAVTADYFRKHHGGSLPLGILRTVVPAAPDAWITALERFGTISFADAAHEAIRLARDGFPVQPFYTEVIAEHAHNIAKWPTAAAIYLPDGKPPIPGRLFRQEDLGRTLQHMADVEAAAAALGGRLAGLEAVRDVFYRGDIAAAMVRHQREEGGFLTAADLAGYSVVVEPSLTRTYGAITVHSCGPWCQGPALLQVLNLCDFDRLRALGHNSVGYVHRLLEAIKFAFADRHAYYGDPKFVDVPMAALLSDAYAERRHRLIAEDRASPGMPPAGRPAELGISDRRLPEVAEPATPLPHGPPDTAYVCVVDSFGNAFSGTPSDGCTEAPVVPGTGLTVSPRGLQSWTDPLVPSVVEPGKRPRLTPNPAMAVWANGDFMPFGTPGGDTMVQAMAQVLLNIELFGQLPQDAVDAPRFISYSFPSSVEPHAYEPGRVSLEEGIGEAVAAELDRKGHRIDWLPDWSPATAGVCCIRAGGGIIEGATDPRRAGSIVGW